MINMERKQADVKKVVKKGEQVRKKNKGGGAEPRRFNALKKKVDKIIAQKSRLLSNAEDYRLITSPAEMWEYFKAAAVAGEIAIDTETTGLDPILDKLVGVAIYTPGQKPAYIPMGHTTLTGELLPGQMPPEPVKRAFDIIRDTAKYYHNAKFDIRVLKNQLLGYYPSVEWDTLIAHRFLNENEPVGLKYLYDTYVGDPDDVSATFNVLFDKTPFNFVPIEIGYLYAAKDPKMTFDLAKFQQNYLTPTAENCKAKNLVKAAKLYHETELPLIPIVARMEDRGIRIDERVAEDLRVEYTAEMEEIKEVLRRELAKLGIDQLPEELRAKLSDPPNPNSPQQLAIIFYDLLKFKSPDKEKPRGTSDNILEHFAEKYKKHKKLIEAIREYRRVGKLLSTYVDKLPKEVKEKTGRLHGSFNQGGTVTGRFSSSDPNLQNIPSKNKSIRKMFLPGEGMYMIAADYSQQEPRVLAHVANDEGMIQAYREGKDLYSWIAGFIYNLPYEECLEDHSPEAARRRQSMKSIILGLMYGRGVSSIAEQLGVSKTKAQEIVDLFFAKFPKIRRLLEKLQQQVRETGYVETVYGRKRRLPEFNLPPIEVYKSDGSPAGDDIARYYWAKMRSVWDREEREAIKRQARREHGLKIIDNSGKIAYAKRQLLNSVIQGTSADITKKAMLLIGTNERLQELGYEMLLTVHDEIIGEVPKENVAEAVEIVKNLMIKAAEEIKVPMRVDVDVVERWYGENVDYEAT